MSEHSAEEALQKMLEAECPRDEAGASEFFWAGVAVAVARQYAADREKLIALLVTQRVNSYDGADPAAVADALLADDGPLVDAAEVWDDGWNKSEEYGYPENETPGYYDNPYREPRA
jgi:hypothetical protein